MLWDARVPASLARRQSLTVHAICPGTLSSPLSLQPGGLQGHDEKQNIRVVLRPPGAALSPDAGQVAEWLFPA